MLKLGLISILMSLGACAETSHRWGFAGAPVATASRPLAQGFTTASAGQPTRSGFNVPARQTTEPARWGFAEVPTGRAPGMQSAQR